MLAGGQWRGAMGDLDATPEDLRRAQAGLEAELRNARAKLAVAEASVASAHVRCAKPCMHARSIACMRMHAPQLYASLRNHVVMPLTGGAGCSYSRLWHGRQEAPGGGAHRVALLRRQRRTEGAN